MRVTISGGKITKFELSNSDPLHSFLLEAGGVFAGENENGRLYDFPGKGEAEMNRIYQSRELEGFVRAGTASSIDLDYPSEARPGSYRIVVRRNPLKASPPAPLLAPYFAVRSWSGAHVMRQILLEDGKTWTSEFVERYETLKAAKRDAVRMNKEWLKKRKEEAEVRREFPERGREEEQWRR